LQKISGKITINNSEDFLEEKLQTLEKKELLKDAVNFFKSNVKKIEIVRNNKL
jgi:hypothetical protein